MTAPSIPMREGVHRWVVRDGKVLRIALVSRIRRHWLRRTLMIAMFPFVTILTALYLLAWLVWRLIGATILLPLEYVHSVAVLTDSLFARWKEPYTDQPAADAPDYAEAAYWNFDARRKGYAEWKGMPQSERDAFKAEYRAALTQEKDSPR